MKKFSLLALISLVGLLWIPRITGADSNESPVSEHREEHAHDHGGHQEHEEHGEHADHEGYEEHGSGEAHENHAEHADHAAHAEHDERRGHEDHGGEAGHEGREPGDGAHEAHGAHGEHGHHDENLVVLSPEGGSMAGVRISTVEKRRISRTLELPGEVGFNEDNLAHVTPRYGGILRDVRGRLGQYVKRGQVLAVVENNATLSRYEVKAPISGLIIEKHATRGEFASEQSSIYVVANLASVWVNLDVYPRYVENVTVGTGVTIRAVGIDARDSGVVTYVAPVFDKRKRSATARVVVRNRNNRWRPGTFVTATVGIRTDEEVPAVENDAVQALEGGKCLFVPSGEGFKPVLVEIGVRGSDYTEILEGIALNEPYVAKGAFELKAELVTSSLGDHAGHGH